MSVAFPMLLQLKFTLIERSGLIEIAGELDAQEISLLESAIEEAVISGVSNVVLDISRLEFIGSAGMRAIIQGADRLDRSGAALSVRSATPIAARIFAICEVAHLLEC